MKIFKWPFGKIKFKKFKLWKPVVVVEIGNDWLKIAENNPSPSGGGIAAINLKKLAQIKENVSIAISKIFKDLSLNRKSVILCIPRHLITIRALDLPSVDPREIKDIISLQVGKQTPYSKDEIIFAYKSIYSVRDGYTKVILAIAQRGIINDRIETLKNAGITVGKVFVSSEGVYSWFGISHPQQTKPDDAETIALFDIDSNYSDFIAVRGGNMVFTKNIFIGANHLTDQAEPWMKKLCEELKRCLERYYVEEKNTKITKVFLSGAAGDIEGLETSLAGALDLPVEKTDTFRNVRMKRGFKFTQDQETKFVSLTPIIGTAVNPASMELELTPGEQKISKLMETKRKDLTIMGILLISIAMLSSFLLLLNLCYKSAYLSQLKKKVVDISGESSEVEKMNMSVELVKHTLNAKNSSLNILHEIYRIAPTEIAFTDIDIDEGKQVILKGRGFVMSDVFKLVKKLNESEMFEDVKASYTRTKKDRVNDKDVEYAEFEIMCPLKTQ